MRQNNVMPSNLEFGAKPGTVSMGKKWKSREQRNSYDLHWLCKNGRDCYCMFNPYTEHMTETRDIMWVHCMYYTQPEAKHEVIVYLQVDYLSSLKMQKQGRV